MNNLSYDDISLVAKYYDANHRSEIPTTVQLGNHSFKIPVIPSNMKCVVDFQLSEWLGQNGYFYIMHRFCDYDKILSWIKNHQNSGFPISISVGATDMDKSFIRQIDQLQLRVDYITIDIAHGHCKMMKEMIQYIKDFLPAYIIAGNVMTSDAVRDLREWGASCIKIGIGPGASCLTRFKTGFHSPMFSTVKNCCGCLPDNMEGKVKLIKKWREEYSRTGIVFDPMSFDRSKTEEEFIKEKISNLENFPIIADGGVRHNGDIFKALVAGARMVMVGSLFSACIDSPAEDVYNREGVLIGKQYYGSASEYNKGHKKNIEGTLIQLNCNGMTYKEKLNEITQDLQSAISYSGHNSLENVTNVEHIILK